ncbi:hypothetical protein, partial [Nocardia cyriacigeorgica]|uniref:hypothetical protein n=1 Tax=Nocardia cyriacigeorgica TaxID=135487 RepID=UPI0024581BE9
MSKAIADAPVNRAWVIALAMVIATHETPLGKSLWHDHPATTPAYLYLLACAGGGGGGGGAGRGCSRTRRGRGAVRGAARVRMIRGPGRRTVIGPR